MLLSKSVRWCVAVVGLVSVFLLTPAEVLAAKSGAGDSIEVQAGTKFERDYRAKELAWFERILVQPFEKRVEGKPWGATAKAFVNDSVSALVNDCGCEWPEEQAAEARRLLEAGCDDPLVMLFAGRTLFKMEDRAGDAKKRFDAALRTAEAEKLPAVLRRFLVMQTLTLPHTGVRKMEETLYKQVGTLTEECLAEGSYGAEDGEIFLRHITFSPWLKTLDEAPDVFSNVVASEKLPEWVRHTLKGKMEVERAWLSRGGGWASTVKPEGWVGFEKRLELARAELVRAWDLRQDQPYAAATMISVVMGGNAVPAEDERLWFDRATAAQFDFEPAYLNYMLALRPRWGGSLRDLLAFGRVCRATNRYDTEVPRMFTRACNDIVADLEQWEPFYRSKADPKLAAEMVDHHRKLLAEPTREAMHWLDRSYFAVNAWLVADYTAASEALKGLSEGRLHPIAVEKLMRLELDEAVFRREIAVMSSPVRPDYESAMKAFRKGDRKQPEELLRQALKSAPEEAKGAIEAYLSLLETRNVYESGQWVKLPILPGLPGWRRVHGNWKGTRNGEMQVTGEGKKAILVFEMPPGHAYEMRGEFTSESAKPTDLVAGVMIGYNGLNHWLNLSAVVWHDVGESQGVGTLARGFAMIGAPLTKVDMKPVNEFLVRVSGGRVTFTVNGTPILKDQAPDEEMENSPSTLLGVGSFDVAKGRTTTFRNLEIRRLDGGKK